MSDNFMTLILRQDNEAVARMQFGVMRELHELSQNAALASGFKLAEGRWYREVNDTTVRNEVDRLVKSGFLRPIASWRVVENGTIGDHEFGPAWRDDGQRIYYDMPAARIIWMNKIRQARRQKFAELGFRDKPHPEIEAMLSHETRAQLKALRDLPQSFDLGAATTIEELKAMWPDELEGSK